MRILFAGNFNVAAGTGYSTILANLGTELVALGHEVVILGEYWTKAQHDYPFKVIPSDYNWIPAQAIRLQDAMEFDHAILAMDIPKIANLLATATMWQDWRAPTSALFPIESEPILPIWAERLGRLEHRFVISDFGQRVLAEDAGLDSVFLPVSAQIPQTGIITSDTQRRAIRSEVRRLVLLGNPDAVTRDGPILVTVADNQERKDLPAIAQAVKILADRGHPVGWILVTALGSPHGWHFPQLLIQTDIEDHAAVIPWGISQDKLDLVYQAADLFVLASQAEGACLPLYEAMAHGVQCIAPDHTAITEALDGRGNLVAPAYQTIHPFGNVIRHHVDPVTLADAIEHTSVVCPPMWEKPEALADFIKGRPWSATAKILEAALNVETTEETEPAPEAIFERTMAPALDPVPAG
jgi:glycosyltransferase involved in cell wall biosynthesis